MSSKPTKLALRFANLGTLFGAAALAAALVVPPQPSAAQSAQRVQDQIIGTYRLARYSGHGDEPTGRISYDAAGRMWAMLLPPDRAPVGNDSTPEEYRATMRGVVAYYGTYTIDTATQRVIHHVEAASNPAWIGDDFVRWYRFDGPNLLISLNDRFDNPLLWERLPEQSTPVAAAAARRTEASTN